MLKKTIDLYFEAVEQRNLSLMMSLVSQSSDLNLIMPNGHLVKGYHDFKKLHENWFDDHDWTMKKEILSINKSESTGTCLAKVHYIDLDEDGKRYEIDYYLFLLFMKCDGKWLLIHDQNTLIK